MLDLPSLANLRGRLLDDPIWLMNDAVLKIVHVCIIVVLDRVVDPSPFASRLDLGIHINRVVGTGSTLSIDEVLSNVPVCDGLVHFLLLSCQRCIKKVLLLRREVFLDLYLDSAKEERFQDVVQSSDNGAFVAYRSIGVDPFKVEPLLKLIDIVENVRQDEVEE